MNCALYARVSTDKQAEKELSIPAQLQAMRDYARHHGWLVVEEFLEPGVSAKTTERPALQQLLAKVRRDSGVQVVLVHKIDRLARNVYDHATIKALLKQHGVRLASVVENVDDTVSGQLVENIMASIAQFYSANLADEVRKGMRQKVLKGGWPHRPPRGYKQIQAEPEQASRVEVDPEVGPLMRKAFELYATGWCSLKVLAAMLAREGLTSRSGQPVAAQYLRDLLANPFYIGRLRWKDIEVEGAHEPLVSPELFEQVQAVMRRRFKDPRSKGRTNGFPLRGVAVCAFCRGHMTAGWQRSGWTGRRWGYYRCSRRTYNRALCNASKGCRAEIANRAVREICQSLHLEPTLVESILSAAVSIVRTTTADSAAKANSARIKLVKLREKETRLTELFLAGDVPSETYRETSTKIKVAINQVQTNLHKLQIDQTDIMKRVEGTLRQTETVADLHSQLNDTHQAQLLRAVFDTVVLDETGVVGFTLRPPFDSIRRIRDAGQLARDLVRHAEDFALPEAA